MSYVEEAMSYMVEAARYGIDLTLFDFRTIDGRLHILDVPADEWMAEVKATNVPYMDAGWGEE